MSVSACRDNVCACVRLRMRMRGAVARLIDVALLAHSDLAADGGERAAGGERVDGQEVVALGVRRGEERAGRAREASAAKGVCAAAAGRARRWRGQPRARALNGAALTLHVAVRRRGPACATLRVWRSAQRTAHARRAKPPPAHASAARAHQRRQAVAVVLAAVVVHQLVLQQPAHLLERAACRRGEPRERAAATAAQPRAAPLRSPAMVSTSGAGTNSWFFMPISTATSVRHASCAPGTASFSAVRRSAHRVIGRLRRAAAATRLLHVAQLVDIKFHFSRRQGPWTAQRFGVTCRPRLTLALPLVWRP